MIAESSKVSALRKSTQSQTAPKKPAKALFDGYIFLDDEGYFINFIDQSLPGKTQKHGYLIWP